MYIIMKDQIRIFISKETFTDLRKIGDDTLLFEEGIFAVSYTHLTLPTNREV